jgi:tetratricopeptide (TPR) repeat protein/tRNA A-37 threonylcarbamoyl transferase component Bud32
MPETNPPSRQFIHCAQCGLDYSRRMSIDGVCPRCLLQGTEARHALRVSCPHCQQYLAVDDVEDADVFCHACGNRFRVDLADTTEFLKCVPPRIGRFELLEQIGSGSFGTVWRARDTRLDRTVALKIPRQGRFANHEEEIRFLREGRVAASLRHAGIVTVHEVDQADGQPFIVSEYVRGTTLANWLKRQRVTCRQAAEWAAEIADVLDYSHGMGVVHRDLKPSNIILEMRGGPVQDSEPGATVLAPRLMDFGMAKQETAGTTVTLDGQIIGTPAYMSPEQIVASHDVDGRADVYSLGVVLYELLTGELPFRGTPQRILQQVLHEEPRAPRLLNDRIPRDLETIVFKCLEKSVARRYTRARDLAEDLRRWLAGESIRARPIGSCERVGRWCRRRPAISALSAALLLVFVAGFAGVTWQWRRAEAGLREAERQRARAEVNYRQARQTVDEFLSDVERKLGDVPGLQSLHRELMERALKYYRQFVRENPNAPEMQLDIARTLHRIGVIVRESGTGEEALKTFDQALEQYEELRRADPSVQHLTSDLAMFYQDLGTLNAQLGRSKKALAAFQKAREYYDRIPARDRDLNQRINAAHLHNGIGLMTADLGQSLAAVEHHRRAQSEYEELLREFPGNAHVQCGFGFTLTCMARARLLGGHSADALELVDRAIPVIRGALGRFPNEMTWRHRLATSYLTLGRARLEVHREHEALDATRLALEIENRLADENPSVAQYDELRSVIQAEAGAMEHRLGRSREGLVDVQAAIDLQEKWIPNDSFPSLQCTLARSYLEKGTILSETGRAAETGPLCEQSRRLLETVLRQYPEQVECYRLLGRGWLLSGRVLERTGDIDGARLAYGRSVEYFTKGCEAAPEQPAFRRNLAEARAKLK